jgi:hypothetical protein
MAMGALLVNDDEKASKVQKALRQAAIELREEGDEDLARQTEIALEKGDTEVLEKLYDLFTVEDQGYFNRWYPGQVLVCEHGADSIPPRTIVVFKARAGAPFVNVLVPGDPEPRLHDENEFREAAIEEIHAAMRCGAN